MKSKLKIKILAVGQVLTSTTVKQTTRKINLSVIEVPENNAYGADYEKKSIPFDVEVHNHNIETFGINTKVAGELAEVEIIHKPYRKDASSPTQFNLLVNNLQFLV